MGGPPRRRYQGGTTLEELQPATRFDLGEGLEVTFFREIKNNSLNAELLAKSIVEDYVRRSGPELYKEMAKLMLEGEVDFYIRLEVTTGFYKDGLPPGWVDKLTVSEIRD